jgi:hypothetical protein
MRKTIPICQIHGEALREEHCVDDENHGYISGYCGKCAKHYRLCTEVQYMEHCVRLVNHDGEHRGGWGATWIGEWLH